MSIFTSFSKFAWLAKLEHSAKLSFERSFLVTRSLIWIAAIATLIRVVISTLIRVALTAESSLVRIMTAIEATVAIASSIVALASLGSTVVMGKASSLLLSVVVVRSVAASTSTLRHLARRVVEGACALC